MKKLLSIVMAFVFCMSLVCVPAEAVDYITYELNVFDNGDGTATVTAYSPANINSGKIVISTSDNLTYVPGSGVVGNLPNAVLNESYSRDGVEGVSIVFASVSAINEVRQIFQGTYNIASGAAISSEDVFAAEWNVTDGSQSLGSQEDGNVDVKFEYKTYTVTFFDKDGKVLKTEDVKAGGAATAPEAPVVEGMDFAGWDRAFDNVTADLTVKAQYSAKVFTVTFIGFGGEVLQNGPVAYGEAAVAPTALKVEGYTFKGWDKSFDRITSDLTVTAIYEISKYTVNFLCLRGEILKTETVIHGSAATPPEAPVIEGYTFMGWNKAYDVITADTDITTIYQINRYTVSFIGKNGETLKNESVAYGYSAVAPDAPEIEGYVFIGWDKEFNEIKAETTVTAIYGHSVEFVGMNGVSIETVYVKHDEAATAPEAPEVKGYTFTGWDVDFSEVTSNITVTAIYELSGIFGDVNFDGEVNNLDASSLLKYDAGIYGDSDIAMDFSDVNRDGKINNLDASNVLKYDAGIIPNL